MQEYQAVIPDFEKVLRWAKLKHQESLQIIFDTYFDITFHYIIKRINDTEVAEDITSEIWEKIYFSLESLQEVSEEYFRNWIMKITRNRLIDFFRKRKILIEDIDIYEHIPQEETPHSILLKNEEREKLEWFFSQISEKQSLCLKMRYFQDMRNKEIAQKLKMSETTVASHMKRWLKNLKSFIQK